jgi:TP901 family phage tail tape measure protein
MNGDLGLGVIVSMKDAFSQNAAKVQTSMQSLDATVAASSERMTRNLDRIQKGTMMIGAGLALMAVPVGLVASTAATQKALGELSSLGVKDLRAIEDAAESFTNKWSGSNKAEFITAAYDVRSALSGLTDEAVGSFTAMAALTGKATKATTEEMVGTFTTAYGIFKPLMQDMSDAQWARTFAGAMAQTVASFKTNGRQMADAIKNIGAVAASSNVPLQEQLAILGQLQTTMPGSEAGTLYKAFIMKAAEAGEKLGLSFVDSTGRLKGIISILDEIKGRFPDLSQAAAQVEIKKAFGSDEAVKFLLQMSQGAEALESNIQSVSRAMKTGTAVTEEMAQAMNMDIGSQFKLLWQQIANLSEILGRTLLPVVTPIIQGISKAVLFFQKLAKSMPGLTRVLLTLSMALGAVLAVVGGVIAAAGTIGLMLPAIKAGLAAMGAAVAGVGSAFATYFLPVVAIIGGVVLAVYLLKRAWETNFGGIRDLVLGAWEKVKLVFQGIRELISSLSGGSGRMSAELARKLEQAGLMGLVVTVFRIYYRVRQFLTGLWQAFSNAFGKIRAILEPAVRALMQAYGALYRAVFSVLEIFGLAATSTDA